MFLLLSVLRGLHFDAKLLLLLRKRPHLSQAQCVPWVPLSPAKPQECLLGAHTMQHAAEPALRSCLPSAPEHSCTLRGPCRLQLGPIMGDPGEEGPKDTESPERECRRGGGSWGRKSESRSGGLT